MDTAGNGMDMVEHAQVHSAHGGRTIDPAQPRDRDQRTSLQKDKARDPQGAKFQSMPLNMIEWPSCTLCFFGGPLFSQQPLGSTC